MGLSAEPNLLIRLVRDLVNNLRGQGPHRYRNDRCSSGDRQRS